MKKGLPYALALVALATVVGFGLALDDYGESMGVRRVPSVCALAGLAMGAQLPLILKRQPAISRGRLWLVSGMVAVMVPTLTASVPWVARHDASFGTYLGLATMDLAIGILGFFLLLPLGRVIATRGGSARAG